MAALALAALLPQQPEDAKQELPTQDSLVTGKPDTMPARIYQTLIGQQSRLSLNDGSQIRLNTDSIVEVSYNANSRRIHLIRGEARFRVAKHLSRPFDVWAGSHIVRAVGTAFNVLVSGGPGMEVTVTQGQIGMLDGDAHEPVSGQRAHGPGIALATAVAGQLITVSSGGKSRVRDIDTEEVADRTARQSRMLVFRRNPLRAVIKEFSRYSSQRYVPSDESIGDIAVGGFFQTADVDGYLKALRENFALETWVDGDAIMIGRRTTPTARYGP